MLYLYSVLIKLLLYIYSTMKEILQNQYRNKFAELGSFKGIKRPKEGWIRTLRKALGMSSLQLADRLGVSTPRATQMERMEVEDRITLKQLRRVADSLDCELVYALVPRTSIDSMIEKQARNKARDLVMKADIQMKLEAQQLSDEALKTQVKHEIERLIRDMPRDLWNANNPGDV